MSGGSAKPKRRRAAAAGLRYEHRPGRSVSERVKERDWSCGFGCLVLLGSLVLITPLVFMDEYWGHDIWRDWAPAWPGGAYAFAATVGALVPVVFGLFVGPPTRMHWKKSKPRSLAWAVASLPGLAGCYLIAGIIGATWRPKRRKNWDADCHAAGGPCWVHEQYPFLWAVGLAATVVVVALLVALLVRCVEREPGGSDSSSAPTPTQPSTSAPPDSPPPRSPTRTSDRPRPE